jgi:hypothetical protein
VYIKWLQVCEMAAVMRMAVKLEEEREWEQRELLARLLTENKVFAGGLLGLILPIKVFREGPQS